jgi:hypothetical protein
MPNFERRGKVKTETKLFVVSLFPGIVQPGTSEQLFSVPGVELGDFIGVNKPTPQTGLSIGGSRASANGQIGVTFVNDTGGPITPTQGEFYTILSVEKEDCDCDDDCDDD